jgi:SAM-dependent methyltransferase
LNAVNKWHAELLGTPKWAALPYPDGSFDTVGMFTMLHHVPTRALQDAILAGALRALRPGGTLIGSDSLASDRLHRHHEGDTYNPVEPAAFLTRCRRSASARSP